MFLNKLYITLSLGSYQKFTDCVRNDIEVNVQQLCVNANLITIQCCDSDLFNKYTDSSKENYYKPPVKLIFAAIVIIYNNVMSFHLKLHFYKITTGPQTIL